MRKQRNEESVSTKTLHLWSYSAARKAVPYLRAVVRSVRDYSLEVQQARRQIQQRNARTGRPDRQTLIRRAEAVQDLEHAFGELEAALEELKVLDVYSLDPAKGLALIPFGQGDDLAWFVFDLFAPQGLEAWRFHGDPLETRRPLLQDSSAVLPAPEHCLPE
jgi:hypothetical protein